MNQQRLVLWNPYASQAEANMDLKADIQQTPDTRIHELSEQDNLKDFLEKQSHHPLLVIAGGDGTIHKVLNQVGASNEKFDFAVLPLGTGNDLANATFGKISPWDCWQAIAEDRLISRKLDLGKVKVDQQELYFFNSIGGGISAEFSKNVTKGEKKTLGSLTYLKGSLEVITNPKRFHVNYRLDDGEWNAREIANFFASSSSICGGGLEVAPGAKNNDGMLHFITYRAMNSIDRVILMTDYLAGRYEENEAVKSEVCNRLELNSEETLKVSIDGEIKSGCHFQIELFPQALEIQIPDLSE
ncbi:MAG TPA: hypothetical protein DD473_03590 [Planctomycetaceae bacterium]|nr:hypothetical protein [Planctomycetaceae bacterium]